MGVALTGPNMFGKQNAGVLASCLEFRRLTPAERLMWDVKSLHEEWVQRQAIKLLESQGAEVKQSSIRIKMHTCKCGNREYPSGATDQSPGITDLIVRFPHWPSCVWCTIEIKGEKTRISPEQARLASTGAIKIAYTALQALEIMESVDRELKGIINGK